MFGEKYPNKAFFALKLGIFVFPQNFAVIQLEGADFKYENSFLKF